VLDTQRNVLHNVMRYTNALAITEDDRLTLLQRPAFSGAVSSLFGALLNGATSCLFDLDAEGAARLPGWLEEHRITMYHSVPALFRRLAVAGRCYATVRTVRLEGDLASPRDVEIFRRHFPAHAVLSHGLGATECGLVRRFQLAASDSWEGGVVPIGYSVEDMDVVVVDEAGREVARGEVGEIAVRSRYLALGYWKRPALTAARFLDEPASGTRTYLTGDVGRMAPDGCLEHLGRKDFQIIVGGARVEVEAVESALVSSGHAREAAVTLRTAEDGRARLVGLIVPAGDAPTAGALRRAVAARVPRSSIPSEFFVVEALPVGDTGKVDRTALAALEARRVRPGGDSVVPRDDVERALTGLWEEHLGVRPVGVRDEFLNLGGDSLTAAALLAAVEERFGRALEPSLVLDGGTVETMARALAEPHPPEPSPAIVTVQRGDGLRPFFYAHGDVLGGAAYCATLARALGSARPFHAIVPHGTRGGGVPSSLEAMAAERLAAVLALDSRGPYLIGGHCMMGGLLAFELACQLEASGRAVDVVILVDTAPPGSEAGLRPAERRLLGALEATSRILRQDTTRRLRVLLACRRVAQALLRRAGMRARADRGRDELVMAYRRATLGYRPGHLRARLVLLWPEQAPVMPPAAAADAWSTLASTVVLSPVPGTHATAVTRHLDTFARVLARALRS
jgi:thioesterase domain-containing protein/acyl carrier protein